MIYEIAMGVGTPLEIARRHGYTDADFIILNAYKWFERAVQAARTELESAGFTFERKMAMMNRHLAPEIDTLLLISEPHHAFVSASIVREVAMMGGDVSQLVPPVVSAALAAKTRGLRGAPVLA